MKWIATLYNIINSPWFYIPLLVYIGLVLLWMFPFFNSYNFYINSRLRQYIQEHRIFYDLKDLKIDENRREYFAPTFSEYTEWGDMMLFKESSKRHRRKAIKTGLIMLTPAILVIVFLLWVEKGYIGGESHMYSVQQLRVIKYKKTNKEHYIAELANGSKVTIDNENVKFKTKISNKNSNQTAVVTKYYKNKCWKDFNLDIPKPKLEITKYKLEWVKTN